MSEVTFPSVVQADLSLPCLNAIILNAEKEFFGFVLREFSTLGFCAVKKLVFWR